MPDSHAALASAAQVEQPPKILPTPENNQPDGQNRDEGTNVCGGGHPLHVTTEMIDGVLSEDPNVQVLAVRQFRQLSCHNEIAMDSITENNFIPRFVEFLKSDNFPLQFEVAWVLTNLASRSSEYVQKMIAADATIELVKLLSSSNSKVQGEVLWVLGNIAGDSPDGRDHVLACGAVPPLIRLLSETSDPATLMNGAWMLSNLCRGKSPRPDWELISPAIPTLAKFLRSSDNEILRDACWALAYLSDNSDDRIKVIVDSGVSQRAVELLRSSSSRIQVPALRLVGNIATSDSHTESLISLGVLKELLPLVSSSSNEIRKDAWWTISNIATGPPSHIQALVDSKIISHLANAMEKDRLSIRKEACWAIHNATRSPAGAALIEYSDAQECIASLCNTLNTSYTEYTRLALESLKRFVVAGHPKGAPFIPTVNTYASHIENIGGLPGVHRLWYDNDFSTRKNAYFLMNELFDDEGQEN